MIPYVLTSSTNDHISTIGSYKRLANLLSAASRLERLDGRTNEAAFLGGWSAFGSGMNPHAVVS